MTDDIGGREALGGRHLVLVGLMGAGKSTVGRSLARRLDLPFVDADDEIEHAAGITITDIFEEYGEAEFRRLERNVIARLLAGPQRVIATGGGAFMDTETRALVAQTGLSVWLRVPLRVLAARTERRGNKRPLLAKGDHRATLAKLLEVREPVYRQADLTVEAGGGAAERTAEAVLAEMAKGEPVQ